MHLFKFFVYLYFCKGIFGFSSSYNECQNRNFYIFPIKKQLDLPLSNKFLHDFPSLTEVFPEINYFFNIFKIKKRSCKTDNDCSSPLKCCDNPLDKYNKICCFGNGQKLVTNKSMFAYT